MVGLVSTVDRCARDDLVWVVVIAGLRYLCLAWLGISIRYWTRSPVNVNAPEVRARFFCERGSALFAVIMLDFIGIVTLVLREDFPALSGAGAGAGSFTDGYA